MANNLPSYATFDPDEEISSLPQKWEDYYGGLEDLMAACAITDHERRWSTLRFYGGEKLRKLEKQLVYDKGRLFGADPNANPAVAGAPDHYRALKEALTAHFAPCVNETYARFKFRSITQNEDESIDTFVTSLRSQAAHCAFHDADKDSQIRDQIVFGCLSKKIRRKALAENLSLDRLIQVARAEESARANAAEIEKAGDLRGDDTADVMKVAKKPGKYSSRSAFSASEKFESDGRVPNPPKADRKCYNCGGPFPHTRNKPCPAKGKACNKCSKLNHFASQCRGEQSSVLAATANLDSSDDYDLTGDLGEVRCIGSVIEKPQLVKIRSHGGLINFNPDTGADVTLIDRSVYSQLCPRPTLHKTAIKLHPYGANRPLKLLGFYVTKLTVGVRSVDEKIFVSDSLNKQVSLLSRSASKALGLVTLTLPDEGPHGNIHSMPARATTNRHGSLTHPLLEQYPDICEGVGCHKDLGISLPLREGATHKVAPPSRIPINLLPKVKAELDRLEAEGVFESVPVDDNVQSISRLVPAPKRVEGSDEVGVRITFDWRELNKNLDKVHHQVLTVEELKATLANAKRFSQIDLKDAFYQLPLDEASKRLTTFSTPWGLKRSTRLIQGALPSSAICHEVLRRDLEGISGAINIADNILVFGCGDTEEEAAKDHDRALRSVLDMFRRTGMTINRKKCVFNATETKFFGFIFSAEGIAPDPDKVQALKEASAPTSKEEVRSFLGLAGFNSQFIPDYATKSEPLRGLTRKGVNFKWGQAEKESFGSIKDTISEATLLSYYDTKKETALFTDASPVGVNAILAQKDENGLWKPVNIASRALNKTEMEYDQLEREALAMHFGCMRFKIFLQGIHFTHFIDPEPLKKMMEGTKREAPARIDKTRLKLQSFDSTIELVKGKHNPADYLSRHPLPYGLCSKAEKASYRDIQNHLFYVAQKLPEAITVPRVREEIKKDTVVSEVMSLLRAGVKTCPSKKSLAPFKPIWPELSIGMGILLRGERVVLPRSLIQDALAIAHQGHMGIGKTKRYLRFCVWFPKMDALVENLVKKCLPCQAVTPEPQRDPLFMTPLPAEPWQLVAADIFGPLPSGEKVLVLKCLRSKWPEIKIFLKNQSTNAAGVIFAMEKMFTTHGIPDVVRTDNGPPFNGKCFKAFSTKFGFQHHKVTPLWPEANGQAEAFMKCLGKVVRTAHIENRDWKAAINDFLRAYRATPHPSTGVAPAQLMYPRRRFKTQLPRLSGASVSDAAVAEFNRRAMQKAKEYADRKRKAAPSSLVVGDTVLVRQQKKNKLSSFYDPKPYQIVAIKGSMVSARRVGHAIVRNASFFKRISPLPQRQSSTPSPVKTTPRPSALPAFIPVAKTSRGDPVLADGGAGVEGDGGGGNDSGDEVFVDAEDLSLADDIQRPPTVPAPAPVTPALAGTAPAIPAFHPSPGLAPSNRNFSLPASLRPAPPYAFRPRP